MKNDFRGLIVGWVEPIYVKLKEVGKLAVRHFNTITNLTSEKPVCPIQYQARIQDFSQRGVRFNKISLHARAH